MHDDGMLTRIYSSLGIDPKTSLDWRIYDLEGLTHFFHNGVAALANKLHITKDDFVLSPGEGSGAPSRLIVKMTGCKIVGIDINPAQIAKAKACARLHGIEEKVSYVEQNVEDFSLEKHDFTKAYVNETCGHWQHKEKAFARIHAHLQTKALLGFNVWLKGDKGDLNEAYDPIPEFRDLYKKDIWFQDTLDTYNALLEQAGFSILESYDCTDKIDIKMRSRLRAQKHWELYGQLMGLEAQERGKRYYDGMIKTHYDFLRYGVIIAQKT